MSGALGFPSTMRAAVLTGIGGPDMLVVRSDVPVPVPGRGEVLIAVKACGMNNTDINTRTAWYSRSVTEGTTVAGSAEGFAGSGADDSTWGGGALKFPRIQGADPCGHVVAVGHGVDEARLGERVLIDPWMRATDDPLDRARAGYFGSECDGGFAQYTIAPAGNAHVLDSSLSDVELASFPCSWSTAEHMLSRVDLRSGQTVAITGASGGVGSAGVQLAKRRGARVVAVAGRAKLEAVADLGADDLVPRDLDDVQGAAVEAAGGRLDVVFDVVGGDGFGAWLEALRRGGRYVTAQAAFVAKQHIGNIVITI